MARYALKIEGENELIRKFKRLGLKAVGVVDRATSEGASTAQNIADSLAPVPCVDFEVDPSNHKLGRAVYLLGVDTKTWWYIFFETGASSHEIAPISKGKRIQGKTPKMALSWVGTDGRVFAKEVDHPGMAARPFLRPAIEDNQQLILKIMGNRFRIELDTEAE